MPDAVVMGLKCFFMKDVNDYCLQKTDGKIRDERTCDKSPDANLTPVSQAHGLIFKPASHKAFMSTLVLSFSQ